MVNKVEFSQNARQQLKEGINILAKAVIGTLGPSGRNVIIEQDTGTFISTKDGVTVAKSINLEDKLQNVGAQLVKQASTKTGDQAGDGTTTSTLLAKQLYNAAEELSYEELPTGERLNLIELKRGIDRGVKDVVTLLQSYSRDITDGNQLRQIATVSANNDTQIGELIAAAMDKVGVEGVITVEESRTGETYLDTVEGIQFNRGYKSPYFVTNNSTMQAVLTKPLILITSERISQIAPLLPLLESVSQQQRSLLIIAEEIEGEALSTLVVNKGRGTLLCAAVQAPEFGDKRKATLEDIAILTGGTVVSKEKGMRLDKFDRTWLGEAQKVTVDKNTTTIINAMGDPELIGNRIDEIKAQIEISTSNYEIENLQDRLSKFAGGVAIVYTGGLTEVEIKERRDRVEDALHATKAALEEGILPGGGLALLHASWDLANIDLEDSTPSERLGREVLISALKAPFTQILLNTGETLNTVKDREDFLRNSNKGVWFGLNSRTKKYVDMFEEGIIDPTKVTRLALENASSVAGIILTTEAVVYSTENNQEKNNSLGEMFNNY